MIDSNTLLLLGGLMLSAGILAKIIAVRAALRFRCWKLTAHASSAWTPSHLLVSDAAPFGANFGFAPSECTESLLMSDLAQLNVPATCSTARN